MSVEIFWNVLFIKVSNQPPLTPKKEIDILNSLNDVLEDDEDEKYA